MKIQHLRFLTAVVDYGSVIRAAERLHRSQPSLSAGLKALEQELGRPLFDRSAQPNRALRLTPAGRRFYQHALEILQRCETARAEFLGESVERSRVRIGLLDTLPRNTISAAVEFLTEREPKLEVDLWEGSVDRVAAWLTQERIDIAWTTVNDLTPNARVLWREPLVAVVTHDHPFAKSRKHISIRDLGDEPFVHRSCCELDAVGRAQLKAAGVKLRVTVRAQREEFAFQLIRDGKGITLAPKSLVPDELAAVMVSGLTVARIIGLQWREGVDSAILTSVAAAVADATSQASNHPRSNGILNKRRRMKKRSQTVRRS